MIVRNEMDRLIRCVECGRAVTDKEIEAGVSSLCVHMLKEKMRPRRPLPEPPRESKMTPKEAERIYLEGKQERLNRLISSLEVEIRDQLRRGHLKFLWNTWNLNYQVSDLTEDVCKHFKKRGWKFKKHSNQIELTFESKNLLGKKAPLKPKAPRNKIVKEKFWPSERSPVNFLSSLPTSKVIKFFSDLWKSILRWLSK
jgi:hypothetical protein